MTIHKSQHRADWYVLGLDFRIKFRGSYDECQAFCEGTAKSIGDEQHRRRTNPCPAIASRRDGIVDNHHHG